MIALKKKKYNNMIGTGREVEGKRERDDHREKVKKKKGIGKMNSKQKKNAFDSPLVLIFVVSGDGGRTRRGP